MGYLTNFIVYTFAMVGVVVLALLVFKTTTNTDIKSNSKFLKIHDTLSLGPRKTLYVVSAGDEKFLIAGDVDKTALISKLSTQNRTNENYSEVLNIEKNDFSNKNFKETIEIASQKTQYMDKNIVGIYSTQNKPYNSVMKNLAEKIKG